MTDDLVKRALAMPSSKLCCEMARRIEELEAKNRELAMQLLAAHGQAQEALERAVQAEAALTEARIEGARLMQEAAADFCRRTIMATPYQNTKPQFAGYVADYVDDDLLQGSQTRHHGLGYEAAIRALDPAKIAQASAPASGECKAEDEVAEARQHLDKMLGWADDLSLQCAESRPKFREDYNAAAGFLDGDDIVNAEAERDWWQERAEGLRAEVARAVQAAYLAGWRTTSCGWNAEMMPEPEADAYWREERDTALAALDLDLAEIKENPDD